jgi:hypothetical protein
MWAPPATIKMVDMHYVRQTDVAVGDSLCLTAAVGHTAISDPYVRRPAAVGNKGKPSDIAYLRRFNAYVRWLWPSEVL